MTPEPRDAGSRVVVRELAESPDEAIERGFDIEPMAPPDVAPEVAALGASDVVVQIESASVGWVDLIMASGQYQHLLQPPYTPGLEYAGVVRWLGGDAAAGAHGERLKIGDRVLVDGLLAGPRSLGAYQQWGGWASYGVAPVAAVHQIPGTLDVDQACNLLGSYETAYHALVTRGKLQAGETVLIHGASGATGLAAVHVAKILGATVIATGRSPEKLAIVAAEGADHVIATRDENLRDRVKALTGGKGVDVVHDGVGGDISLESMRCVRFGARYLIVGWAATPTVARGKGQRGSPNANHLPTNLIMMKGLDVLGCPAAISIVHDPSLRPPRIAQVMRWAADGRIAPRVSHRFALADYQAAMRARWSGDVIGGCVLHP